MELKEILPIVLAQYAFTLPYFFIWTIGIILAASRKRLHPGPSQVALIGLMILFLHLLITAPLNALVPTILDEQGRSMVEIGLITAGIGFVGMIFGSVAWIFILMAIFGWRNVDGAPKQRHGCLTTYLIVAILVNILVAYVYLFLTLGETLSPFWVGPVLFLVSLGSVIFFIALFFWKKWGFYGLVLLTLIVILVNIYLVVTTPGSMRLLYLGGAFRELVFIAFVYGVLHIGEENKGWPQLE